MGKSDQELEAEHQIQEEKKDKLSGSEKLNLMKKMKEKQVSILVLPI